MTKIETLGSQIFSVPATEEGELFIQLCHKYLNNLKFGIRKKTRAKNRKERYQEMVDLGLIDRIPHIYHRDSHALPMPFCDWVAIYFPRHSVFKIQRRINILKMKRKNKK